MRKVRISRCPNCFFLSDYNINGDEDPQVTEITTYRLLNNLVGLTISKRFPSTVFKAKVNQKILYIPLRAFSKQPCLCLHFAVLECRHTGKCKRSMIDFSSFFGLAISPPPFSRCSSGRRRSSLLKPVLSSSIIPLIRIS